MRPKGSLAAALALFALLCAAPAQGAFVAVGAFGSISSPDGITWSGAAGGGDYVLRGVAWSPSAGWAVVGWGVAGSPSAAYGIALHSSDGLQWDVAWQGGGALTGVAWSGDQGGRFVAVGGTTVLASPDGLSWSRTCPSPSNPACPAALPGWPAASAHGGLLRVAFGRPESGGLWVATSSSGVFSSPDAVSWSQEAVSAPFGQGVVGGGIASDGSRFLAVGTDGAWALRLASGSWIVQAMPDRANLGGVAYSQAAGGSWVVTTFQGSASPAIYHSPDPLTVPWAQSPGGLLYGVGAGGSNWMAVGGPFGVTALASSGAPWWSWSSLSPTSCTGELWDVAWANGRWVAVGGWQGEMQHVIMTSDDDGAHWRSQGRSPCTLYGVAHGDDTWVSVGATDAEPLPKSAAAWSGVPAIIQTSEDGRRWTLRNDGPMGTPQDLLGVAWSHAQHRWVAVGGASNALAFPWNRAVALTSDDDGVTWQAHVVPTDNDLVAVASSGTHWVAVGVGGTMFGSDDGATWTPVATGTSMVLHGIATDGSRWVAVGNDLACGSGPGTVSCGPSAVGPPGRLTFARTGTAGVLLESGDGTHWTPLPGPTPPLTGVATAGHDWVAVGNAGTVLRSSDGVSWVASGPAGTTQLDGVATDRLLWDTAGIPVGLNTPAQQAFIQSSPTASSWSQVPSGLASGSSIDIVNGIAADYRPPECALPAAGPLYAGDPITFTAAFGNPPYTWSGGGDPATGAGSSFTTSWNAPGTYAVVASDGSSQPVAAPCPSVTLLAKPTCAPAHVDASPGSKVDFTVTAGVAPYAWTVLGLPHPGAGATVHVDLDDLGLYTIQVRDAGGKVATCTASVPGSPPPPAHKPGQSCQDSDGDGVCDFADDCPGIPNADQQPQGRPFGYACDPAPCGVGIPVLLDAAGHVTCPSAPKAKHAGAGILDTDQDGIADAADDCPFVADRDQRDIDGDGVGDACDADMDGDGIPNPVGPLGQGWSGAPKEAPFPLRPGYYDNCPITPNPNQRDADGDGVGDACGTRATSRPESLLPKAYVPPARAAAASSWIPLGLAAVLATLVLVARWLLGPAIVVLFSRLRQSDLLDHPVRAWIVQRVAAEPGIHFSDLVRVAQRSQGATKHHLRVLEAAGLVHAERTGGLTRYFPPDKGTSARAGQLRTLVRSGVARQLAALLMAQPGRDVPWLARECGTGYGAVAYHLRKLQRAGFVELRDDGVLRAYPLKAMLDLGDARALAG